VRIIKKAIMTKLSKDLEAALKIDPNITEAKQLLEKIRQAKAEVEK